MVKVMREYGVDVGFMLGEGELYLFDMYRDLDGKRWGYVLEGYRFLLEWVGRL